jgi:site-specific recombinase XerD
MKALSHEEMNSLLDAAESLRDRTMFYIAFRHGMRASEICGLKTEDVQLHHKRIIVRRLKGSLTTTQELSKEGVRMLQEWFEEREKNREWKKSRFVFPTQKSERMDRSQFFRIFRLAAQKAGVPKDKQHPHVLKHSLGIALVEANVNMAEIKQALGHKSISSTAVYTQVTDEMASKAMRRIDED